MVQTQQGCAADVEVRIMGEVAVTSCLLCGAEFKMGWLKCGACGTKRSLPEQEAAAVLSFLSAASIDAKERSVEGMAAAAKVLMDAGTTSLVELPREDAREFLQALALDGSARQKAVEQLHSSRPNRTRLQTGASVQSLLG